MSDGFAPGDRVREIDPNGDGAGAWGQADANRDAAAATADAAPIIAGNPLAGRGRRIVRSTSGEATLDASTAMAEAPATPRTLDWSPDTPQGIPYEERKKPLKGRKAQRAYEAELAARRRAEEERAAAEANVEARGAAGFRDEARHGSRVAMSNPTYTPSKMYEAGDPRAPKLGKPWYKRLAIVVPIAVVVLAALVVGLGVPAFIQIAATNEADRAAAEFRQSIVEYDAAWTSDNLDALVAAAPHLGVAETPNALLQPLDAKRTLLDECTVLAESTRVAGDLAANPPPTLAVLPSTSFSATYREAQEADASLSSERQAAQTLLGALSATVPVLSAFCTNYQAGAAIEDRAVLRDTQELQPLRTIPTGGTFVLEGTTITCGEAPGCVDLGNEQARLSYASAWREIQEERVLALISHYREQCWLDVLRPYCQRMGDAWDAAKGGIASISQALGNEKPARDASQGLFPRLDQAIADQAAAFQGIAQQAAVTAGSIDPLVLTDQAEGWETRMLTRLVTAYESHLGQAVADYRDTVGR